MGIGLLIAGVIFLLNPNINIVDVLPDFIGYILIYRGLYRLADIEGRIESSMTKARWLIIVGLVKFLCMFMIPSASDSDVLLFTFCFAVVELLLCIPMFTEFFGGMNYLCSRYDNEKALEREGEAKFFICAFVIIKNTLVLIPELFSLDGSAYGYELTYDYYNRVYNIEIYKKISIIGVFLVVLICGVFMGTKFVSYLNKLRKNREFIGKLEDFYRVNVLNDHVLWSRRRQNFVLNVFAVGILFFNNVYIDTFPIIPDFIGFALLLVGALYLSKLDVNAFGLSILSVLGIAVSVLGNIYRLYNSQFGAFSAYYLDYCKTPFALPLDVASAVLILLALISAFRHVAVITADNPDGIVFPKIALSVAAVPLAFSTAIYDLLPLIENTAIAATFSDCYAFGTFLVGVVTFAVTVAGALKLIKMKTNPER